MNIEVISLKPDDVLVIQCEANFSEQELKVVKQLVQKEFRHERVVVVSPLVKLAVVRSEEA
jgi:hypothetical protein